jgi:hypothetical protein
VTLETSLSPDALADQLRARPYPIFSRIKDMRVLFDPRTLLEGDNSRIVEALTEILSTTEA